MNEEEQEEIQEQHKGLGGATWMLMLVVAALFDGIQILLSLIPVAGWALSAAIGFVAGATFFLWFLLKGQRFLTAGRIITMTGTLFVEVIPIADAFPTWTLSIILMFITSKFGRTTKVAGIITSRK